MADDENVHNAGGSIAPANYQQEYLMFIVDCHNWATDCTISLQDLEMGVDSGMNVTGAFMGVGAEDKTATVVETSARM